MLRYAAVTAAAITLSGSQHIEQRAACIDMMRDAVAKSLPISPKLRDGITLEQYQSAIACTLAKLSTECAKRACKNDVRGCAEVREYETAEHKACGN